MPDAEYQGPETISYCRFPGRGRSYRLLVEGHDIQIAVSEKGLRVRVYVDGDERK